MSLWFIDTKRNRTSKVSYQKKMTFRNSNLTDSRALSSIERNDGLAAAELPPDERETGCAAGVSAEPKRACFDADSPYRYPIRNTSIGDGWTATATETARKTKTMDWRTKEKDSTIDSSSNKLLVFSTLYHFFYSLKNCRKAMQTSGEEKLQRFDSLWPTCFIVCCGRGWDGYSGSCGWCTEWHLYFIRYLYQWH